MRALPSDASLWQRPQRVDKVSPVISRITTATDLTLSYDSCFTRTQGFQPFFKLSHCLEKLHHCTKATDSKFDPIRLLAVHSQCVCLMNRLTASSSLLKVYRCHQQKESIPKGAFGLFDIGISVPRSPLDARRRA